MEPNFSIDNIFYSIWKFPSGEIQIKITTLDSYDADTIYITGSILCSDHIIELLQLVEAIRCSSPSCRLVLKMPYCAYSRQDRRCNPGESLSIKVFASLINSCNFDNVITYDNHSDVATALINNCIHVPVDLLLERRIYPQIYSYLISPDAGADKKVFNVSKVTGIPVINASKIRDTTTGNITKTIVHTTYEELEDKTVLIVDDICQGGRTFEELAKALKAIEPSVIIHLYVTHGFFSSGFGRLREAGISKFITTNSVYSHNNRTNTSDVSVINILS